MNTELIVADFVTARIEFTGKLHKDIAKEVGFRKPNMITMIKQGKSRLPLDKIGPMTKALEVNPMELLHMCMEAYHPETWKAIEPLLLSRSIGTTEVGPTGL